MYPTLSLRAFAPVAGLLLLSPAIATAFPVNVSQTADPKANVMLNSYQAGGHSFNNFILTSNAQTLFTAPANLPLPYRPDPGTLSVDKGINATGIGPYENPTDADITAHLGNLNLNNIMDVEEYGQFGLNIQFSRAITDNHAGSDMIGELLVFERGRNSDINIQGLDANGNLIGNQIRLVRNGHLGSTQVDSGYQIHTTETGQQKVGLWEVDLDMLGVTSISGLQVGVPLGDNTFNGPDFKIVGVDTTGAGPGTVTSAPEPSSAVLAAVAVAMLGFRGWRRRLARK